MTQTVPHILQVLPALTTGGTEKGTLEMARAIVAAGGKAFVAASDGPLRIKLRAAGAAFIELPLNRKSPCAILKNSAALAHVILTERIDLVHARSRAPAWAARRAARKTKTPMVTTWHGVHNAGWPGKKMYNAVLAEGARVIAPSHYIARRLQQEYTVDQTRLRFIPRGVDTDAFSPTAVSGPRMQRLADRWRTSAGTPLIMLPARFTRWKGHLLLLEALAQLQNRYSAPWLCVFVGPADPEDPYVKEVHQQSRQLSLNERLRFAGECDDMPAALALADVVVVPSLKPEPFGRTVIEAQALGKPVIVTGHGGALETVIPNRTGLIVPPHNALALSDALLTILEMPPEARHYLAETAVMHIRNNYTSERMQAQTLAVYDEILKSSLAARFKETLG